MKTELDNARTWSLEHIVFKSEEDELYVRMVELFVTGEVEDLKIGDKVFENLRKVEPSPDSRVALVLFSDIIAWQVVDESYTIFDKAEELDSETGFLRQVLKSSYLEYLNSNHGWYKDMRDNTAMYRLWTEDSVIEVVCIDPPTITFE